MGLEIFSINNKTVVDMEGKMRDSNVRLYIGVLVMLVYLLIGAIVFVRLEYPLERIERETHWEYREQWTNRLLSAGIEGGKDGLRLINLDGAVGNHNFVQNDYYFTMGYVYPQRLAPKVDCRTIVILSVIVTIYFVIGAFFFQFFEADHEEQVRQHFIHAVNRFIEKNGVSRSEIDRLFADIRDAAINGIWMEKNVTSSPNWSFGQAFFFAGTLVSTVGYGRVSPRTEHGKLFTIVYCIIGIPLTLALLSAIVARLRRPSQLLRGFLNKKLAHIFHAGQIQMFHLATVCTLLLVFVFIIPAWIFTNIEPEWTFLDAFYYCFVSLTTIGLGDYEPGDSPDQEYRSVYKVIATVYLLVGLCCMMLFLATLYEIPYFDLTRFFLKSEEETRMVDENEVGPKYGRFSEDGGSQSYENGFYQAQ